MYGYSGLGLWGRLSPEPITGYLWGVLLKKIEGLRYAAFRSIFCITL